MDELLLSRIRLEIVGRLVAAEWVTFTELRESVHATNGNLGSHLAKLIDANYVEDQKRFVDGRPQSRYRLTRVGRSTLLKHVAALQALVESSRQRS